MNKQQRKWEQELWDSKYTPENLSIERIMDSNDEERLEMILWTLTHKNENNKEV